MNVRIDATTDSNKLEDTIPFNLDTGEDQCAVAIIQDHVEYHNDFSIGVYDMGDITMKNLTSVDGIKAHYWKTYRRGTNSPPLVDGGYFRSNPKHLVDLV